MTQRPTDTGNQAPGSALGARQGAEHPQRGTRPGEGGELGPQNGAQGLACIARHRAAIEDVMLLALPDARFRGAAGIRRIQEWADWLAEQAAAVTELEVRRLAAERDLLASTLAVHTRQTTAEVLADTRAALNS